MKKSTWVVTLHFNRGHVQVLNFVSKAEAKDAINIAVFNNEDCINCSIYKTETVEKEENMEEKVNNILQKAFEQNRKEWAQ
jgi:hypothetical protein